MITRRKFLLLSSASAAALALPIPKFATGGAIIPRPGSIVIPEQWIATGEAMRLRAAYRRAHPLFVMAWNKLQEPGNDEVHSSG